MTTKFIEFFNSKKEILRGIAVLPDVSPKKGVVFLHGFERTATTEKKFKKLADGLVERGIASFRFDFSGCGLSDGDFRFTTVSSMAEDAKAALGVFKEKTEIEDISIAAHSVSACAAAKLFEEDKNMFSKTVLIAPALNQKDLLRFWFVKGYMKKKDRNLEINWNNFRKYLNEEEFQKDCARENRMTKANYILNEYFLENKEKDYSAAFENAGKGRMLYVHGNNDDKVPLESLNIRFNNTVIVIGGDHDMEKPDMMEQWMDKSVGFLVG